MHISVHKQSMHKKQKKDEESEWSGDKKRQSLPSNHRCILHTSEISNIGNFTSFIFVNHLQTKSSKFCITYDTEDWKKTQILNITWKMCANWFQIPSQMWTLRTPDGIGDVTSILQWTLIASNQNLRQC